MKNQFKITSVRDAYLKAIKDVEVFAFLKNDVKLIGTVIMVDETGLVLASHGKSQQVIAWDALASLSPKRQESHNLSKDSKALVLDVDALFAEQNKKDAPTPTVNKLQQHFFRQVRNLAESRNSSLIVANYTVSGTPIKGEPVVCDDEVQIIINHFGGLQLVRWDAISTVNCEVPKAKVY
ncbi:hypothetical protein CGI42_24125 [Vibrio parahaemolyticus]|uniref:hypothetical protein n=1 Tax=Vibrio parahaemolyticus TaxID=670 RepID=UPI00112230D1|nr:hypothetical protein [Vibrio parahaemolyticus]TOJ40944.1 hypothetical protein CGI42_24125 [Vibrio parahaemolyticus]